MSHLIGTDKEIREALRDQPPERPDYTACHACLGGPYEEDAIGEVHDDR